MQEERAEVCKGGEVGMWVSVGNREQLPGAGVRVRLERVWGLTMKGLDAGNGDAADTARARA